MARKGTKKEKIISKAVEIIKANPDGIRYSDLIAKLHAQYPKIAHGTITGAVWNLDQKLPQRIDKPAWGLFRHTDYRSEDEQEEEKDKTEKIAEKDFYQLFADWLMNEECTHAIPLGGNRFKDKWETPDVIGVREPERGGVIQFTTEVVSAELKTDTGKLITAFGQACAYKLFSHKSYIVVPKSSSPEDRLRLDALCQILGIGLVLFDNQKPRDPGFEIRVRPMKHEPDMFYVNKYLKHVPELWRR